MKYWYDTEFIENGSTIELLSIGIVSEDGRELYLQTQRGAWYHQHPEHCSNDWVRDNVCPYLDNSASGWGELKAQLQQFCDPEKYGKPELWGYYSSYDHVALCQLFGTMMDLPSGWPMYTRDLRQWADSLGITEDLDKLIPQEGEHHALADARWNKKAWEYLNGIGRPVFAGHAVDSTPTIL